MRCSSCEADAVIDQPYRGAHLCAPHFRESVEERVRREMHRQLPRFARGTVAVALSGGKDSGVALALSQRYFRRRPTVRLVAVSVDEGIAGYRAGTLAAARTLTESLGIEHHIVTAQETIGTTTDRAAAELPGTVPCSFCGVWRRQLLNRAARDVGADALVLGFNLDDLSQTVLMNLVRGDLDRLVRMAPHRVRQPGLVPRVAPLALIPEREVYLYARLQDIPFDHGECPHAGRAARNLFREVVWQLEEAQPGTRQSLLRTHEKLVTRFLREEGAGAAPDRCRACGEPSAGGLCRACEYLEIARTVAPTPEVS
ncbi:MAG: TIGR00269 family protein [Thermoplasmata archaeon]|nr:TIGR00269 family protein [Thermoplasmata archaeon]